jgi:hypothetical protein
VVQLVPSLDACSWNAVAYAASQYSWICVTVATWPRSTWSHCGSEKALDQRVPVVLPSTAADAGVPAFSVDEAVAGWPCESRPVAALAGRAVIAAYIPTMASTAEATTTKILRRRRRGVTGVCMEFLSGHSEDSGGRTRERRTPRDGTVSAYLEVRSVVERSGDRFIRLY